MKDRLVVVCLLNTHLWDVPADPGQTPDPAGLPKGLAERGITVRYRRLNRVPLNPMAGRGTFYAGFDLLRALRVLLFDRDADVVFSVGESNLVAVLLLAPLLRFRVPTVLREVSARGWRRRDRVVDFVVPRVTQLDVLTPHQKRRLPTEFTLQAPPVLTGFAVDDTFFHPLPDVPEVLRIVAVGDDAGRDYPTLIEACRSLDWPLVLRTATRPAVPDTMRDRVELLGRLSFLELRNLYASAAVVAVPVGTADHPSGITAIFEAMAMGRAVVTSATGLAEGVIEHGRNGLVVPPGDPVALRTALAQLMGDPALRARLGAAARADIEGRLSYRAYVDRTAASLRQAAVRASG